jgi:hypothetical protein
MQLLILYDYLNCEKLLEDGKLSFYLSLLSTVFNLLTYIILKILRMRAIKEKFVLSTLEGMTANTTWLPYQSRLRKDQDDSLHFGILRTSIGPLSSVLGVFYDVEF